MKRLLMIVLCAALLGGCARGAPESKSGHTRVRFSKAKPPLNIASEIQKIFSPQLFSTINGQMMIYIIGVDEDGIRDTILLDNEEDPDAEAVLPNGDYVFHSVGFDNSSFGTTVFCGLGAGGGIVELEGDDVQVSLLMKTDDCNDPIFAPATLINGSNVGTLKMYGCDNTPASVYGSDCGSAGSAYAAAKNEYLIQLVGYEDYGEGFEETGDVINGPCMYEGGSVGFGTSATTRLPFGGTFAVRILAFATASNDCSGAYLGDFFYPDGLTGTEANGRVTALIPDTYDGHLYLENY